MQLFGDLLALRKQGRVQNGRFSNCGGDDHCRNVRFALFYLDFVTVAGTCGVNRVCSWGGEWADLGGAEGSITAIMMQSIPGPRRISIK